MDFRERFSKFIPDKIEFQNCRNKRSGRTSAPCIDILIMINNEVNNLQIFLSDVLIRVVKNNYINEKLCDPSFKKSIHFKCDQSFVLQTFHCFIFWHLILIIVRWIKLEVWCNKVGTSYLYHSFPPLILFRNRRFVMVGRHRTSNIVDSEEHYIRPYQAQQTVGCCASQFAFI